MILHTLNKAPSHEALSKQLADIADTGDSILLIEDGVYHCLSSTLLTDEYAKENKVQVYALSEDALARGISIDNNNITFIDYAKFVELTLTHDKVISWY